MVNAKADISKHGLELWAWGRHYSQEDMTDHAVCGIWSASRTTLWAIDYCNGGRLGSKRNPLGQGYGGTKVDFG